jgi:hypothetical protein
MKEEMHDCQRYREDWVAGIAEKAADCEECRSFCAEAQAILQAADGSAQPMPELSEEYWNGLEYRLRERLIQENASKVRLYWKWGSLTAAAAAAVVVVTWGGFRAVRPIVDVAESERIEYFNDHIQGLDPMVVMFLEQSEMFLRSFTKIEPSDVEDLADAYDRANQGLEEITEQKAMAGDFVPVRITLDEYESVLREIRNLDSADDLEDIKSRIRRNGLIANLKAYQPHAVLVSRR